MERTAAQLDELTGVILTAYTNVEKTVEGEEQAVCGYPFSAAVTLAPPPGASALTVGISVRLS